MAKAHMMYSIKYILEVLFINLSGKYIIIIIISPKYSSVGFLCKISLTILPGLTGYYLIVWFPFSYHSVSSISLGRELSQNNWVYREIA